MSDTSTYSAYRTDVRQAREWLHISAQDRMLLAFILGVLAMGRVFAMFLLPFTDTTEARYAEMARIMAETGDWITPQIDYGVPFWGKPPLHTWLAAAGIEIFGANGFGARLPIFLCSLAVLWTTFAFVRSEMGRNAALVTVTILASSALFFGASAFVMTDMVMTLGVVLVMAGVWMSQGEPRTLWGYCVFLGLAIGLLAKGPVAVVLCIIPLAIWVTLARRWEVITMLPWLQGGMLLVVLVAPWYLIAEWKTPGFLHYFIIGEHFERFTVPHWQGDLYGSGHERPKGAIWLSWLAAFLPWTLVFVLIVVRAKQMRAVLTSDRSGWVLYLLVWAASPMILFSLSANILTSYVLPGLSASAALLVTLGIKSGVRPDDSRVRTGFVLLSTCFSFFLVLLLSVASLLPQDGGLPSDRDLVKAAQEVDADAPLFFMGQRTYSSAFYSRGKSRSVTGAELEQGLEMPHTLAVRTREETDQPILNTADYQRIGTFGKWALFYLARKNQEAVQ